MGQIEQTAKKRRAWNNIQRAVLSTVAVSGVLLVAMAAPNALQILGGGTRKRYHFNYQVKSTLGRLVEKGYIRFIEKNGRKYAEITEEGRHVFAVEEKRAQLRLKKKRRWDKRWRIIVFDIPEQYKNYRNQLRTRIQDIGFVRVQDSVWVFPYDCEDLVQLLKTDLRVGTYVLYAVAESIENDAALRKHFNLKK